MEMSLNKYEIFTRIDTTTYNWNCRVRIQSKWKGINKETKECWGTNLILLDDSNNKIHGFINTKLGNELAEKVIEGEIYILSNFKVKKYIGHETYRAVRFDKQIYFTEHTQMVKDSSFGVPIEKYAFDLFALEEIPQNADDNRFLIDVVGIVENTRPIISTVKNDVETRRFIFDITDGRKFVNVTLFNEVGEHYHKILEDLSDQQVVIIIAAAKIHKYEGRINLTNFPATRIYVNPQHYSVAELKENYLSRSMLDISSDEDVVSAKNITIAELQALKAGIVEKLYSVTIKIKKFDEKSTWYYARCATCDVEIYTELDKYKCGVCNRIIPHPDKRFRVFAYCADTTGCVGIIFQNAEVQTLIGKSVFDIHAEYPEDQTVEPLPDVLRLLTNKQYKVIVQVNEDNLKNGSRVYEAEEVEFSDEKSGEFSPTELGNHQAEEMSVISETTTNVAGSETPGTGKSSTLKRLKRNNTSFPLALDENVPLKQYKNIKTEKK